MVYTLSDGKKIELGKRVRAIIYYENPKFEDYYLDDDCGGCFSQYLNEDLLFLLLDRKSEDNPGLEFIKEGVQERDKVIIHGSEDIDKTLERTLYRGIEEEIGIREDIFKGYLIGEPLIFDLEGDIISYRNRIQFVRTYGLKVNTTELPIKIRNNDIEHKGYAWFGRERAKKKLWERTRNRRTDWFTLVSILEKGLEKEI